MRRTPTEWAMRPPVAGSKVAIFYPFSPFCKIYISLLSLRKQPRAAPQSISDGGKSMARERSLRLVTLRDAPRRSPAQLGCPTAMFHIGISL